MQIRLTISPQAIPSQLTWKSPSSLSSLRWDNQGECCEKGRAEGERVQEHTAIKASVHNQPQQVHVRVAGGAGRG